MMRVPDERSTAQPDVARAPRAGAGERRRRDTLRSLVDEMMATIRAAAGQELWTPEERARAEEDLERVMAQVRREALSEQRRS